MWIRYWLAAGGVDPDKNVELLTADIPKGSSRGNERFFDGVVYDPTKPQAYLDSLKIKR
jgi:bicarbonate transport system substrate-binding protein